VISQPFWPAYLTAERINKAAKLKLALTAASDPITSICRQRSTLGSRLLRSPIATRSASRSTCDDDSGLVRNYIPSYLQVVDGGWNIADCVSRSYDLEGMQVGRWRLAGSAPQSCAV